METAHLLRKAALALLVVCQNSPQQDYDTNVSSAILELLTHLQKLAKEAAPNTKGLLAQAASNAAFRILSNVCTMTLTHEKFSELCPAILDAMDAFADSAYSRNDRRNLHTHVELLDTRAQSFMPLKPLKSTDRSSAFGVLHGGHGVIHPSYQGSLNVQILAQRLLQLSIEAYGDGAGGHSLDDRIMHVSNALIGFFEERRGVEFEIPYGMLEGLASDLQELFRFAHSQKNTMAHRGRAFLLKLARYLRSLLTETYTAKERGFQDLLEELTVWLLCPVHLAFCLLSDTFAFRTSSRGLTQL